MRALSKVLQSSKAAIDLASIMVGVIIIGLIGGVIAATVFAVIPWSQDKAAKQQLDSVHTAENAFFGLSSDPSQNLVGGKKNSFTNSAELASNNLLTSNVNYCVVNTVDGKDYHAYAKSSSGKTFYALNSNKQAQVFTGTYPCITDANGVVIVDPTVDNGTTPVGTTPGTAPTTPTPTPGSDYGVPVGTVVYSTDFEGEAFNALPAGWNYYNSSGTNGTGANLKVKTTDSNAISANRAQYSGLYANFSRINATKALEMRNAANNGYITGPTVTLTPGTYSASGYTAKGANGSWNTWTLSAKKTTGATVASTTWTPGFQSNGGTSAYVWETHGVDFTVTEEGTYYLNWTGTDAGETTSYLMIDDVKIIKTGTL